MPKLEWKRLLSSKRVLPRSAKPDIRTEFESDLSRIVFSPPVRRMHDKTQVFPLSTDDNIHTRLTHSLEVFCLGDSLAKSIFTKLKKKSGLSDLEIDDIRTITKTACLCHDIGNTPFGHYGEEIISTYFQKQNQLSLKKKLGINNNQWMDFIHFDGNPQGLRVLTKLHPFKSTAGLNLTYSTLASYIKYPSSEVPQSTNLFKKKRGVFYSEFEIFDNIFDDCGLKFDNNLYVRHPISFIVEAADSICNTVIDIEDAFNKKLISKNEIEKIINTGLSPDEIKEIMNPDGDSFLKQMNKSTIFITSFRNVIIKHLLRHAENNFIKHYSEIMTGQFKNELISDNILEKQLFALKKENVFKNKEIELNEITGDAVITGILDYFIGNLLLTNSGKIYEKSLEVISNSIKMASLIENKAESFDKLENYNKIKIIIDFVSGMTDHYALYFYNKLKGGVIN